ncbi:ankyrin repeat protein [Legionella steigerwaltii]|uniref:Ankyrin repeat protein n=1 Tax=Legionella steigerwaltii TaxID=460 RepID=A0A378LC17_9GAMM|nr:ankyrin repeat domain-containing protein [Legionella steigerwaltii]KTD78201.1 ankyrin repeat protein [Legionella steigerwaltii]STY24396.1 ankyrin repeat protein [Legionella steigerwaltii]
MIIVTSITSWNDLIVDQGMDLTTIQDEQIGKLEGWCRKHIKSDFEASNLKSIEALVMDYLALNSQSSLSAVVDTDLGYNVIQKAAKLGFDRFIENGLKTLNEAKAIKLINQQTKYKTTALHLAALGGFFPLIEVLLEHGADPNIISSTGKAPIHLASYINVSNSKEKQKIQKKCIRLLLLKTNQQTAEACDDMGISLLLSVIPFDDEKLFEKILLKCPNLIHTKDLHEQNALHHAIMNQSVHIVRYLLTHYSHSELITERTDNYSTALHLAFRYGTPQIIELLFANHQCLDKRFLNSLDEHQKIAVSYLDKQSSNNVESIETFMKKRGIDKNIISQTSSNNVLFKPQFF